MKDKKMEVKVNKEMDLPRVGFNISALTWILQSVMPNNVTISICKWVTISFLTLMFFGTLFGILLAIQAQKKINKLRKVLINPNSKIYNKK